MNIKNEAEIAEKKIREFVRETPLEYSFPLSKIGDCNVYLKLENQQLTGSFKIRGAMNKILSSENQDEFITASSGNHGIAIAYTLNKFNLKGSLYLPEYTSSSKIEALQEYDIDLNYFGNDCVQAENFAKQKAKEQNLEYISPYNDIRIIGGQATIGLELENQLDSIDSVLIPVGGGGLISGVAGYLKQENENIRIIGCQPRNSSVMFESIKAGHIVQMESKDTISDGTAGGIEEDSITFDMCKKYVDGFIIVEEDEIAKGILFALEKHSQLIEGAAALSIASFIRRKDEFKGKNIILIISGSRISSSNLKEILC